METDDGGAFTKWCLNSALRVVQRWLARHVFRRGARRSDDQVGLSEQATQDRDWYFTEVLRNWSLPPEEQLQDVYTDESYVHEHYKRHRESLWDPNDEQDLQTRDKHKGGRCCFCAAIKGPNPRVRRPRGPEDKAGLIRESIWIFCPQQKPGKSNPHAGDYHKNFQGDNYEAWFRDQLLPSLTVPSLIHVDNAKYHKRRQAEVLRVRGLRKPEVRVELLALGVPDPGKVLKTKLVAMLLERMQIKDQERPAIELMAEKMDHRVIWTPPHHSDLQPIELVWAIVKGNIGLAYSSTRSLGEMRKHLESELDSLCAGKDVANEVDGRNRTHRLIDKTKALLQDFVKKLCATEDALAAAADSKKGEKSGDESSSSEDEWDSDAMSEDP